MKRIMIMGLTVLMCALTYKTPVHAQTIEGDNLAVTVSIIEEGISQIKDGNIISQMIGRSGSRTPTGAKGIAFEVKLKNQLSKTYKNLNVALNPNSIDNFADIIVTDKSGSIVEFIQCKDTPSSVKNVAKAITDGKYEGSTICVTNETYESLMTELAKSDINIDVINTGISTEETSRIATKFLGKTKFTTIVKSSTKVAGLTAVIASAYTLIESIYHGDDAATTAANTISSGGIGFLSAEAAAIAGELAAAGLGAIGAGSTISVVLPAIAVVTIGIASDYALNKIVDMTDLKTKLAEAATISGHWAQNNYEVAKESIRAADIPSKVTSATEITILTATTIYTATIDNIGSASTWIKKKSSN